MSLRQTKICPRCHEKDGWFENVRKNYSQYYDPDGASSFATDGKNFGGTRKYCYNCSRDITKCVTDEKDKQ